MSLERLFEVTKDEESARKYLQNARALIGSEEILCKLCGRKFTLVKNGSSMIWRCPTDKTQRVSARSKSFLYNKKSMPYRSAVRLVYCWAHSVPVGHVASMVGTRSVLSWLCGFRDVCGRWLEDNPVVLGGPGVAVQLDILNVYSADWERKRKRKVEKRKGSAEVEESEEQHQFQEQYQHLEHLVTMTVTTSNSSAKTSEEPRKWVLGGWCPVQKRGFLRVLADLSPETVTPLVREHVLPGSEVHSDARPAYTDIRNVISEDDGSPMYRHAVYAKANDMVDPTTGHRSNGVALFLTRVKRSFNWSSRGIIANLAETYFNEYMWRQKNGGSGMQAMENMLLHLGKYPEAFQARHFGTLQPPSRSKSHLNFIKRNPKKGAAENGVGGSKNKVKAEVKAESDAGLEAEAEAEAEDPIPGAETVDCDGPDYIVPDGFHEEEEEAVTMLGIEEIGSSSASVPTVTVVIPSEPAVASLAPPFFKIEVEGSKKPRLVNRRERGQGEEMDQ